MSCRTRIHIYNMSTLSSDIIIGPEEEKSISKRVIDY